MPRRILAITVVVAALLAGSVAFWGEGNRLARLMSTPTTLPSTTTSFELDAIVASGTVNLEEETALIDEATSAAAEATTTTATPSTTTTTSETTSTAPQPSPSTTEGSNEAATTTTPPATTSPPTTAAGGFESGAESDFASRINSYRGSNGESSLSRDGSLDSYARSWAKKMAENGSLSHSNIGSLLPPWSSAGENVGSGGSVGQIFDALASSGSHSSNMLGDFTHFGIGAYRDSGGVLWTAHVFTR